MEFCRVQARPISDTVVSAQDSERSLEPGALTTVIVANNSDVVRCYRNYWNGFADVRLCLKMKDLLLLKAVMRWQFFCVIK